VHRRGIHIGVEKRRYPNDPGMGSKIPTGINSVKPKVQNKVAKGRGEEYKVFS
jgi:hypothetical protein